CHTGHRYFRDFYHSHTTSDDTSCPCGEYIQTHEHIIHSCPTYEKYHQILRDVSDSLYLPDILGTKAG
ncbi:hypothetical protein P691DRAFT_632430, partial [Macrolepiota fuliginosa MF-IS2]